MEAGEVLFIAFREDMRKFIDKWETVFDTVGYSHVPITNANAMVALRRELKFVDYKMPCEK